MLPPYCNVLWVSRAIGDRGFSLHIHNQYDSLRFCLECPGLRQIAPNKEPPHPSKIRLQLLFNLGADILQETSYASHSCNLTERLVLKDWVTFLSYCRLSVAVESQPPVFCKINASICQCHNVWHSGFGESDHRINHRILRRWPFILAVFQSGTSYLT